MSDIDSIEDLFEPEVTLRSSFHPSGASFTLNVKASGFPQYFQHEDKHGDEDGVVSVLNTTLACIEVDPEITNPAEATIVYLEEHEAQCEQDSRPASQLHEIVAWIHNWYNISLNNPEEIQVVSLVDNTDQPNIWTIIDSKARFEDEPEDVFNSRIIYISLNGEDFLKVLDTEEIIDDIDEDDTDELI